MITASITGTIQDFFFVYKVRKKTHQESTWMPASVYSIPVNNDLGYTECKYIQTFSSN